MEGIVWQGAWRALRVFDSCDEPTVLQRELLNELSSVHPLSALAPVVFGRCAAQDDVVVKLNDGRLAVVHLTFEGQPDAVPTEFPSTTFYSSVAEFNTAMTEDDDEE